MSEVTVGRRGKELVLTIPHDVAVKLGLQEGDRVEVGAQDRALTARRLPPRFTAEELFAGKTPGEWRSIRTAAFLSGHELGMRDAGK